MKKWLVLSVCSLFLLGAFAISVGAQQEAGGKYVGKYVGTSYIYKNERRVKLGDVVGNLTLEYNYNIKDYNCNY